MELVYTLPSLNIFDKSLNADSFLVGNSKYAIRLSFSINNTQLKVLTKKIHKLNKKICVLVNKIFFDDEIEDLHTYLVFLLDCHVDGIYFADFSVANIIKKFNRTDLLFFYHETFLRSKNDIETYQELGLNNIIVSKDSNIDDIIQLNPFNKAHYGINIFGFFSIYHTKRKLLQTFNKTNRLHVLPNDLDLKEQKRNEHYKILEEKSGTTIFSPFALSYANYLDTLKEHCNFFIVDSLFFDKNTSINILNLFFEALHNNASIHDDINNYVETTTGFINHKVEEV